MRSEKRGLLDKTRRVDDLTGQLERIKARMKAQVWHSFWGHQALVWPRQCALPQATKSAAQLHGMVAKRREIEACAIPSRGLMYLHLNAQPGRRRHVRERIQSSSQCCRTVEIEPPAGVPLSRGFRLFGAKR